MSEPSFDVLRSAGLAQIDAETTRLLSRELERQRGQIELIAGDLDVLTGGTDTHLLQLDLRRSSWSGKDAEERLGQVCITVNRNTVPFDERPPTVASGVRLGTPAATMRGFDEQDFRELCRKRPLYPGFAGHTSFVQAVLAA